MKLPCKNLSVRRLSRAMKIHPAALAEQLRKLDECRSRNNEKPGRHSHCPLNPMPFLPHSCWFCCHILNEMKHIVVIESAPIKDRFWPRLCKNASARWLFNIENLPFV
jgi:hypothetical protein